MANESNGSALITAYATTVVRAWAKARNDHRLGPPRPSRGNAASADPLAPNPSSARLTVRKAK